MCFILYIFVNINKHIQIVGLNRRSIQKDDMKKKNEIALHGFQVVDTKIDYKIKLVKLSPPTAVDLHL